MNKQIGDMSNDELMDFIIELQEENSRYERKLDQLTNNWNELEEWLKSYIALIDNPDTFEEQTLEDLEEVLDKMKEIKEKNNGN